MKSARGFTTFSLHKRGFTLVELLVVISIIAILSVIGMAIFTGVQKSARDAKRKADIDAIAKTMEIHYEGCGSRTYCGLQASYFGSGAAPVDPGSYVYCAAWGNTAPVIPPASFTTACPSGWSPVSGAGAGGAPQGNTYWAVCAALENPGSGSPLYCKPSLQ